MVVLYTIEHKEFIFVSITYLLYSKKQSKHCPQMHLEVS